MALPDLHDWTTTRTGLHHAARVLEVIRKAYTERDPHTFLHLALTVDSTGLTTGDLPEVGSVALDFVEAQLRYQPVDGDAISLPISGRTPAELLDQVSDLLPGNSTGYDRDKLPEDGGAVAPDPAQAAAYLTALKTVDAAFRAHRAELTAAATPVVVWPHGFDVSFMAFPGNKLNEWQPHLNFGFSPGSPGFDRPYFYTYAYPYPDDYAVPDLPPLATWNANRGGWTGARIDYDRWRAADAPRDALLTTLAGITTALLPLLET